MSSVMCGQCGWLNAATDVKCQSCGASLPGDPASYSPVEKILRDADPAKQTKPFAQPPPAWSVPPVPQPPPAYIVPAPFVPLVSTGFRCPYCQSTYPPRLVQKVSGAGWVIFALFILFCIPLCWIGLLMKEDYKVCSSCGMALG
ncbi:MAG TPA: LITAF-like zinc ribbon domain-containing protein [Pyrinomonadaceae bacterium]|nr:LITAF-like zinc ribbon domain-containing protein [Pyrinomonadaceae bacterium]